MTTRIVAACLGILWVSVWPELPSITWLRFSWLLSAPLSLTILTSLVLIVLVLLLPIARQWNLLLVFALGVVWAIVAGHGTLAQQLAPADEGGDFLLVGEIASLPQQRRGYSRFEFEVDADASAQLTQRLPAAMPERLLISWYGRYNIQAGQRWQMLLRLKAPRGSVNQAGFDYQRWLLSQGFGATGYVRDSEDNKLLARGAQPLQRLRASLAQWIANTRPESEFLGPLTALAVGERDRMTDEQWLLFSRTGTSHLMAISGLHIGLAALFGYGFGFALRALAALLGRHPRWVFVLPGLTSCLAAALYAAIAGFALPTQRALVMIVVFNLALLSGGRVGAGLGLAWALLLVLLLDPLAGFDLGFWLSFGAVGSLLLYFRPRRSFEKQPSRWRRLKDFGQAQFVVFVGLFLPLLILALPVSWLSPLANSVVIPLVSFAVVLPLLLALAIHGILPALAALLLSLADTSFSFAWRYLEFVDQLGPVAVDLGTRASTNGWLTFAQFVLAGFGLLLVFLPKGMPARWLCFPLLLPLLLPLNPERPPLQISFLDVGQGLAVAIHGRDKTLVYDVGAQVNERFDMANAVVLPHLKSMGVAELDHLIISHGDNDHAGAAEALLAEIPIKRLHLGEALTAKAMPPWPLPEAEDCDGDESWQWDEVEFHLIEPSTTPGRANNNRSCILLIRFRDQHILLPGDIEAAVERQLIKEGRLGPVTVLAAPHHGSRSSSTAAFVREVAPQHVVYSAGFRNRYRHPHPMVVARYEALGAQGHYSGQAGQIDFIWQEDGQLHVRHWRQHQRRWWFNKPEVDAALEAR